MSDSRARGWLGLWLSALVAVLQIGGVHVHLCLDGFEPYQTLHWGDADLRDAQLHAAASHRDVDLCVQPPALTRALHWQPLLPLPLILFVTLCALAPVKLPHRAARRFRAPPRRFLRLLPPAQAPPF